MSKNLKLLPIVLIAIFLCFSLSFSKEEGKVADEQVTVEKEVPANPVTIPKDATAVPQNYQIPWSSLNGGGTDMASTSYKAMVSTAQSFIGEAQSTNYKAEIGYWYGGKPFLCGDTNGSLNVSVADIVYLINFLLRGGMEPDPRYIGDANGDGKVSVADCVYLINFLLKGSGMPPKC